jgi:hypothetical protein
MSTGGLVNGNSLGPLISSDPGFRDVYEGIKEKKENNPEEAYVGQQ